jgi:hypothetical protein
MGDEGNITRTMHETLLERLNSLEASITEMVKTAVQEGISPSTAQLEAQINESRLQLEAQIESLRLEMNDGFAAIRDEITVVADDTRISRANQKRLLPRIEELEPKVS